MDGPSGNACFICPFQGSDLVTRSNSNSTSRQRLLEIATEVFAEQGFHNARVRDICGRAGVNVAAINYHFGDKKGLYEEVLAHAFRELTGDDPTDFDFDPAAPAEERLEAFVMNLLSQLLSEGRGATYTRLVAREMVDATDALTRVIEEGIRPQVDLLLEVLGDLLGPGADESLTRRCVSSIIGQCLFYHFARPAILQLSLEEHLQPQAIQPLASHVTAFSLAAIERLAAKAHAH